MKRRNVKGAKGKANISYLLVVLYYYLFLLFIIYYFIIIWCNLFRKNEQTTRVKTYEKDFHYGHVWDTHQKSRKNEQTTRVKTFDGREDFRWFLKRSILPDVPGCIWSVYIPLFAMIRHQAPNSFFHRNCMVLHTNCMGKCEVAQRKRGGPIGADYAWYYAGTMREDTHRSLDRNQPSQFFFFLLQIYLKHN